ncbi:unnamed protein product [Soboliphyme baturini]|uniref:Myosin motor domain-containing protein n=1 Tax=Soboliphyme baturini TaxID=241478 RepID=A0A3P8FXL7_9BILA|nr:unnamed protein product [Soboliphyme baturini]
MCIVNATFLFCFSDFIVKIASIDDADWRNQVNLAFRAVPTFKEEDEKFIWTVIASVLHLGNIEFVPSADQENCSVKPSDDAVWAAKLLEVSENDLWQALCYRVVAARSEVMRTGHNVETAQRGKDALAKAIYERLFCWIIAKVNEALAFSPGINQKSGSVIGVLDIYGFEIFQENSFEQFCINYCNEKLQQLFINLVLKQEQEEYQREGISWQEIKYFNNKVICDMIEKPSRSIIASLDDACKSPGEVTDKMVLESMNEHLKENPYFKTRAIDEADKSLQFQIDFRIKHYAGDVNYCILGFSEKNKDPLFQDFKRLLFNSKNPLLSNLFPDGAMRITEITKRPQTSASRFRDSMNRLVDILTSKVPFYIRCIKPNDNMMPFLFDDNRVEHQIAYLGLIENIRVRRAGFAYRISYDRFIKRYVYYKAIFDFKLDNIFLYGTIFVLSLC